MTLLSSLDAEIQGWLVAVGTVGAVIVALGLAAWQGRGSKRRRPVLSITFDDATGIADEEVTFTAQQVLVSGAGAVGQPFTAELGRTLAAYLRFEVTNAPGHDAAEDVEVILTRIEEPSFVAETSTLEISFPSFPWTHLETTRVTIPPGVTRSVDIAAVYKDPPDQQLRDIFRLLVDPEPGAFRNRLKHGTYELVLTVAARNADAVSYRTRVGFDPSRVKDDPSAAINLLDPPTVEQN